MQPNPRRRAEISEIRNIERALSFIDENIKEIPLNKMLLRELHKLAVDGLTPPSSGGEGAFTPGEFRRGNVKINNAVHCPPDATQIDSYLEELLGFINKDFGEKYDLLKVAIAHHRFVWIHPFDNGNGRVVRLLTYAMLVRSGFNVEMGGRLLNPTALFCNNRDLYYRKLAAADFGTREGISEWCEYVLGGLRDEIEKIDRLCDYDFLKTKILFPALKKSLSDGRLSPNDWEVLSIAIEKGTFKSPDLAPAFRGKSKSGLSRYIRRLQDENLILPLTPKGRIYTLSFQNRAIWAPVADCLIDEEFLPETLR
ncbi:MAG: Fic family protein [Opitutales bacterium]|nr:Fic family protein [Opitutales bacterium]